MRHINWVDKIRLKSLQTSGGRRRPEGSVRVGVHWLISAHIVIVCAFRILGSPETHRFRYGGCYGNRVASANNNLPPLCAGCVISPDEQPNLIVIPMPADGCRSPGGFAEQSVAWFVALLLLVCALNVPRLHIQFASER